ARSRLDQRGLDLPIELRGRPRVAQAILSDVLDRAVAIGAPHLGSVELRLRRLHAEAAAPVVEREALARGAAEAEDVEEVDVALAHLPGFSVERPRRLHAVDRGADREPREVVRAAVEGDKLLARSSSAADQAPERAEEVGLAAALHLRAGNALVGDEVARGRAFEQEPALIAREVPHPDRDHLAEAEAKRRPLGHRRSLRLV